MDLPNQCVFVCKQRAAEPPGETPLCEIRTCTPLQPRCLLTLSLPQVNDGVPCSTFNSPLNSSRLLTQAESQCFLHLPFA